MDQLEFKHESNNNFYQEMDNFSDERFKENFEAPNNSKQQTTYKEDVTNPNNKNNNSTADATPFTNNNTDENAANNNNIALPETKALIFKTEEHQIEKYKRIDNLRRITFFVVMIFIKTFFKERFGLDFESFNCDEVLGISICHMKNVLDLQIYQLFCYYKEYKKKILYFIKHEKMNERARSIFYYFMTRTYKELYKRFVSENRFFPLSKKGDKTVNIRINQFITLKKAIQEKTEQLEKKGKDNESIQVAIKAFEDLCKNMISDIENKKNVKGSENENEFKIVKIKKFTYMRNQFPSDDELPVCIELEEES
jgi:hypothetical protein